MLCNYQRLMFNLLSITKNGGIVSEAFCLFQQLCAYIAHLALQLTAPQDPSYISVKALKHFRNSVLQSSSPSKAIPTDANLERPTSFPIQLVLREDVQLVQLSCLSQCIPLFCTVNSSLVARQNMCLNYLRTPSHLVINIFTNPLST